MATLNQTPRRSKRHPHPTPQPPQAIWRQTDIPDRSWLYVALRADGSFVYRQRGAGKWISPTWNLFIRRALGIGIGMKYTLAEAEALMIGQGFERTTLP